MLARSRNIFESDAQTIAVTVNCAGVMGKGIALEARKRFPEVFTRYREMCDRGEMRLGKPTLIGRVEKPWILLFPTKGHWRSASRVEDIVAGLIFLRAHYEQWGIESLAVPPLGCGHGGLDWAIVGPILRVAFQDFNIPVQIFEPMDEKSDPDHPDVVNRSSIQPSLDPSVPPEAVALLLAMRRAFIASARQPISRAQAHGLAYFAAISGIPLECVFECSSGGPYSTKWAEYIKYSIDKGLLLESNPDRRNGSTSYCIGPNLDWYERTAAEQIAPYEATIERLSGLFRQLRPERTEFAALTHFIAQEHAIQHRGAITPSDVVSDVTRIVADRSLSRERIEACLRWLVQERWLSVVLAEDAPGGDLSNR